MDVSFNSLKAKEVGISISDLQVRNVGFGDVSDLSQVLTWRVNPGSVRSVHYCPSPHCYNASQKQGGFVPRALPTADMEGKRNWRR